MATNQALQVNNPRDQLPGLIIIALGWSLFLFSALNYKNVWWFNYLLYGRVLAILGALGLIIYIGFNKDTKIKDTWFYILSLGLQSLHGILEGSTQSDFYSYTGLFYIVAALSTRCSLKEWLTKFFPLQFTFLIVPLFFKGPQYFSSLGRFIDSFSLPVAGFVIGTIIVWINIQRFQTLLDNLQLKHELAEKELFKRQEVQEALDIAKDELIKMAANKAMVEIASQVAHDIRSPLSVINLVSASLDNVSSETRTTLREAVKRINDIANDLLMKSKDTGKDLESAELVELKPILESIISEKKIQFSNKDGFVFSADIQFDNTKVCVNPVNIQRALSNLINNSVEAFDNEQGVIQVYLRKYNNKATIVIEDNGKGMPEDVLAKLGQRGFTSGKDGADSGNGLGVWFAKSTVESCGGEFKIISREGVGTQVYINLPTH